MDRHELAASELEDLTGRDGQVPVSAVTIRRILNATAKTEPERVTLTRIAEACGESYAGAFSYSLEDSTTIERRRAGVAVIVVLHAETGYISTVDSKELDARIAAVLEHAVSITRRNAERA